MMTWINKIFWCKIITLVYFILIQTGQHTYRKYITYFSFHLFYVTLAILAGPDFDFYNTSYCVNDFLSAFEIVDSGSIDFNFSKLQFQQEVIDMMSEVENANLKEDCTSIDLQKTQDEVREERRKEAGSFILFCVTAILWLSFEIIKS